MPVISLYVNCETEAEIDELFVELSDDGDVFMPLDSYPFSEKFVVGLPENRILRGDAFEPTSMEMLYEFASELMKAVEVGVELVVTVARTDEATVTETLEHPIGGVSVVVPLGSEVGDGSRLVEVLTSSPP